MYGNTFFHGSTEIVDKPSLVSRDGKDFGKGFYLVSNKYRAKEFARMAAARDGKDSCVLNKYSISTFDGLKVCWFPHINKRWLNCITGYRYEKYQHIAETYEKYDVIVGKLPDDHLVSLISSYAYEIYGKVRTKSAAEFVLKMVQCKPPTDVFQICFKTDRAIERLKFEGSIKWKSE